MKKVIGKIFLGLGIVILIFIGLFLYATFKTGDDFFIFGYKPEIIKTGSMQPTLKINSLVLIKKGGYDNIKLKDIIAFDVVNMNLKACHEVIEITNEGFITKAINNKYADDAMISEDFYVGKIVFHTNITADYATIINVRGIFVAVILPIIIIAVLITCLILLFRKHDESDDLFKEDSEIDSGDDIINHNDNDNKKPIENITEEDQKKKPVKNKKSKKA